MKKLFLLLLFTSLFSIGISNAQTTDNQQTAAKRVQFVDKNKDGICDNAQNIKANASCPNFVDQNDDGICDNIQKSKTNAGTANCPNFVDTSKDGICDNYQNNAKTQKCCAQGMQCRQGYGNGWRNR